MFRNICSEKSLVIIIFESKPLSHDDSSHFIKVNMCITCQHPLFLSRYDGNKNNAKKNKTWERRIQFLNYTPQCTSLCLQLTHIQRSPHLFSTHLQSIFSLCPCPSDWEGWDGFHVIASVNQHHYNQFCCCISASPHLSQPPTCQSVLTLNLHSSIFPPFFVFWPYPYLYILGTLGHF